MADSELQRLFSASRAVEPDVAAELESMMRLHEVSAEDLFYKWESYCMKLDLDAGEALTLANVRNLKQSMMDELAKAAATPATDMASKHKAERRATGTPRAAANGGGGGGDMYGMLDGLMPSTPTTARGSSKLGRAAAPGSAGGNSLRKRMEASKLASSPAGGMAEQLADMGSGLPHSSFNDRQNAGDVVEVLNGHLASATPPTSDYTAPRIKLTAASDQKKMAYKPLAMKLSEASEILDDRIDDVATLVQRHHGLDDGAFGNPASQGTTEIVAVGRVASDAPEGRLNAASLVLETSRRTGMGFRVPLKMDAVKGWSVFPGQVVALRGTNATGAEFVVREVLEVPLLPNAASTGSALAAHEERMRPRDPDAMSDDYDNDEPPPPLHMIFAAGPYTADDNLNFEPLHALCEQAADEHADVLVLTGPFLDVDHPLIAAGDFDLPEEAAAEADTATMVTLFRYLVAPAIARLAAARPHVTVVVVPSVRDVLDKHVSWPQDAMPRPGTGLPKAARLVTNPMTLSANEVVMGVSAQDALWELRAEELSAAGAAGGDLLARLCRHMIEQRHYFPVHPPTDRARLPRTGTLDGGVATGAMLDVSYLKLGEMVNVRPDVMLTPSALPPFAKVVESVLVINPGYLSKRRGAGTYARMTLHPPKIEGDGLQSHRVFDRAKVEIVRI
ncbi:DNA polymerase alpha/primase associated subunit [Cordyceps fumosorosea ARSEF 2679]|uniref:DNA polymerase alpha subunit B n=1 Tax=Cordyceps fumosorosea (strain ARSEF 2679) TaxID=1081104 RepID=A0A162JUS3_CORFA|nr:DNA polymerase alpha/primase associated subunit [Cordyceps fumosorosea ARSEF 2679]OAA74082.1 DNA polymerase alpha/primase associated subunit [Cordyceps fumosorosea ARSEF 2679]